MLHDPSFWVLLSAVAVVLAAVFAAVWAISFVRGDVSVIDILWGPAFALVAWLCFGIGGGATSRRLLVAVLVTAWGLRLGAYLAWRKRGEEEDRRYAAMRRSRGSSFAWVSLVTIFGTQALLVVVVSLPVQAVAVAHRPGHLWFLDFVGAGVWAIGLAFEAVGDFQLARFKRDAVNDGQVMDRGLWRYTRHPNYFGDFLVWWGIGVIALATHAWWALAGPLVMSALLIKGTGKAMLERDIAKRRPGYADYVQRTSGFVPLPPHRS